MTITLDRSTKRSVKITLKPEDFKTQLYAGLVEVRDWDLLPREEIVWGQPVIGFTVTEPGKYHGMRVFDRPEGGVALMTGLMRPVGFYLNMLPGDTVLCFIKWEGQSEP